MNSAKTVVGLVLVAGMGVWAWSVNRKPVEQPKKPAIVKVVDAQAKRILEKASIATASAKVVRYDAQYDEKPGSSSVQGQVSQDIDRKLFSLSGTKSDGKKPEPEKFELASDGTHFFLVSHNDKRFTHGEVAVTQRMAQIGSEIILREFGMEEPFKQELAGGLQYEGQTEVGGVLCDVVYVKYKQQGVHARWYFGADGLPRRVDRLSNVFAGIPDKLMFVKTLTISNLETNPKLALADYSLTQPEGYEDRELLPPPPLLANGTVGPDWELRDSNGGNMSLASMRGSVVVLDFWATWCKPCIMAMPGLQALYEQHSGQSVKVVGINTADTHKDPGGFMKDKGYTYDIGLNGDAVASAYHVSGYPTFYVLDQQGRIAYSGTGYSKEGEEEIAKVVADLLAQGENADAESGTR